MNIFINILIQSVRRKLYSDIFTEKVGSYQYFSKNLFSIMCFSELVLLEWGWKNHIL